MDDHISLETTGDLLAKLARGEPVYRHEVIGIFRLNPGVCWDGALHHLLLNALEGRLKGKPGPKDGRTRWDWQCIQAAVEFRAMDIVEERADPSFVRTGGTPSPKEQAYEDVARRLRLAGGRALQNRLCSLNLL